jgi:AcrR family transcriptional regulator
MKSRNSPQRDRTRHAILDAMADVITDTKGIGFSVQAVADRAGVTHRTIYNHFPTREALCDAFSDYVDQVLLAGGMVPPSAFAPAEFPQMVGDLYKTLAQRDRYVRAYVMLMIASRHPPSTWKKRSAEMERMISHEVGVPPGLQPHHLTAAIRLFASSMGWHLLTEQCGLSTEEAADTAAWATRALLQAAATTPVKTTTNRRSTGAAKAAKTRRG